MINEAMHHPTSLLSIAGNFTLNLSFVLYLIVYIPQILHNQRTAHLNQLSFGLHTLLMMSYSFDLLYGFAYHLPWQYKIVSVVGLFLVTIQHVQLIRFFVNIKSTFRLKLSLLLFISNGILLLFFFIPLQSTLSFSATCIVGIIARACGLIYCLPQIIKNSLSKSATALSVKYLYLNLIVALLDTCSAWCLNWGWPNKLASPCSAMLMLTMLFQVKKFEHQSLFLMNQFKGIEA